MVHGGRKIHFRPPKIRFHPASSVSIQRPVRPRVSLHHVRSRSANSKRHRYLCIQESSPLRLDATPRHAPRLEWTSRCRCSLRGSWLPIQLRRYLDRGAHMALFRGRITDEGAGGGVWGEAVWGCHQSSVFTVDPKGDAANVDEAYGRAPGASGRHPAIDRGYESESRESRADLERKRQAISNVATRVKLRCPVRAGSPDDGGYKFQLRVCVVCLSSPGLPPAGFIALALAHQAAYAARESGGQLEDS
jgi:hypothetical protein